MDRLHPLITYVLPLRSQQPQVDRDFCEYVAFISSLCEMVVVDGSEQTVFEEHAGTWGKYVHHVSPDPELATPMGKVGGVLTGVRLASHNRVIIADDDIRYTEETLRSVSAALEKAEVVRPQNYFSPLPWHALLDTGRILLNRISGGDWPGTLGISRAHLLAAGGYDGTVMFENLELVRTIIACGGTETVLLSTLVERRPSTTAHYFSQRIRQAYDEFARPVRFAVQLSFLPLCVLAMLAVRPGLLGYAGVLVIMLAEIGRRRGDGSRVFPGVASLLAPIWIVERALCAWLALGARVVFGGVPYRGRILRKAATPLRELREQHEAVRAAFIEASGPRYRSA